MSLKVEIDENIHGKRKERKLSQEALANRLGMSPCYLGGIERGQNNPSIDKLIAVAHALDTPFSSIVSTKSEQIVRVAGKPISTCPFTHHSECLVWKELMEKVHFIDVSNSHET